MVETVNVHEAKTHLSRLLARVEAGERIIIARAGHPIAELTPIAHERPPRVPGHGSSHHPRQLRRPAPRVRGVHVTCACCWTPTRSSGGRPRWQAAVWTGARRVIEPGDGCPRQRRIRVGDRDQGRHRAPRDRRRSGVLGSRTHRSLPVLGAAGRAGACAPGGPPAVDPPRSVRSPPGRAGAG